MIWFLHVSHVAWRRKLLKPLHSSLSFVCGVWSVLWMVNDYVQWHSADQLCSFPKGALLSSKAQSDRDLENTRNEARKIVHALHRAQDRMDDLEVYYNKEEVIVNPSLLFRLRIFNWREKRLESSHFLATIPVCLTILLYMYKWVWSINFLCYVPCHAHKAPRRRSKSGQNTFRSVDLARKNTEAFKWRYSAR